MHMRAHVRLGRPEDAWLVQTVSKISLTESFAFLTPKMLYICIRMYIRDDLLRCRSLTAGAIQSRFTCMAVEDGPAPYSPMLCAEHALDLPICACT